MKFVDYQNDKQEISESQDNVVDENNQIVGKVMMRS